MLYEYIEHLMTQPVGRLPRKPIVWYHSVRCQAASWDYSRRAVTKVEWHKEELFVSSSRT